MLDRLNIRYGVTFTNGGYVGRRFTRAEQVPTDPGRWGGHRSADFIAVDQHNTAHKDLTQEEKDNFRWAGRQSVHVFEVKVSRSDLKHELDDLTKSEAWEQYGNYFWLVIPKELVEYATQRAPERWGILVPHGKSLKAVRSPQRTTAVPMPMSVVAGLVRAAAKTEVRNELLENHALGQVQRELAQYKSETARWKKANQTLLDEVQRLRVESNALDPRLKQSFTERRLT